MTKYYIADCHFGRELPEFLWERKDKVDELKQVISELTN